ncbi:MAG: CHASE domain-containing protein, partial [Candidatus Omnitrophota bacterium]
MDLFSRRYDKKKVRGDIHRYVLAFLVFCLGVTISFVMFTMAREQEKVRLKIEFHSLSNDVAEIVTRNILANLEILYSVKGLYEASFSVEKDEFNKFAENAIKNHEDITSVDWMPRVPDPDRKAYEEGVALLEGTPGFQITELDASGKFVKAPQRKEYFPIQYSVPYDVGKKVLGFNIDSDPANNEAMKRARDTGQPVSTGRIKVIREPKKGYSHKIFVPIYVNGKPHNTIEERRKNIFGFAAILVNIENLVELSFRNMTPVSIETCFYDMSAIAGERFLYFHMPRLRKIATGSKKDAEQIGELNWAGEVDILGRKWLVTCAPNLAFLEKYERTRSPLILIIGAMLAFVSAAYLFNAKGHTTKIESLVTKRTAELEKANKALESELEWHMNAEENLSVTSQQWQKIGRA